MLQSLLFLWRGKPLLLPLPTESVFVPAVSAPQCAALSHRLHPGLGFELAQGGSAEELGVVSAARSRRLDPGAILTTVVRFYAAAAAYPHETSLSNVHDALSTCASLQRFEHRTNMRHQLLKTDPRNCVSFRYLSG